MTARRLEASWTFGAVFELSEAIAFITDEPTFWNPT
ncbi:protein of unknown function (plasmid) [Azospirillum baldaniorum]|uniref:Uncharacterized protein n=1 Tax=Azospirillum baldaniorum TaxID=1064539 RepID=A0A9P1JZY5_9PROT|nr:protein of unknown function [Azospirillum baldaniorum]